MVSAPRARGAPRRRRQRPGTPRLVCRVCAAPGQTRAGHDDTDDDDTDTDDTDDTDTADDTDDTHDDTDDTDDDTDDDSDDDDDTDDDTDNSTDSRGALTTEAGPARLGTQPELSPQHVEPQ